MPDISEDAELKQAASLVNDETPAPKADEPTPAKETEKPEKTETTPVATGDKPADGAKSSPQSTDGSEPQADAGKPAEGTPDKALQKVQQDLAAAMRKLDALGEKQQSGETLTASEKKEVLAAKRKIDEIREKVTDQSFDIFDGAGQLVDAVAETDTDVQTLKKDVAELKQTLADERAAADWKQHSEDYPGVAVKDIWAKCWEEAAAVIGADNPKLKNLASKMFHERSDAAAKSVAAKNKTEPAPEAGKKKPAPAEPPPNTRVSSGGTSPGRAALSDEEQTMQRALSLVRESD